MKYLFLLQIALGIPKAWLAVRAPTTGKRIWHICSGIVIVAMGVLLFLQHSVPR